MQDAIGVWLGQGLVKILSNSNSETCWGEGELPKPLWRRIWKSSVQMEIPSNSKTRCLFLLPREALVDCGLCRRTVGQGGAGYCPQQP